MIIVYSGLQGVSRDLVDATRIGGAHRRRERRRLMNATMPSIDPACPTARLFNHVLPLFGSLRHFTPAFVSGGGAGTMFLYRVATTAPAYRIARDVVVLGTRRCSSSRSGSHAPLGLPAAPGLSGRLGRHEAGGGAGRRKRGPLFRPAVMSRARSALTTVAAVTFVTTWTGSLPPVIYVGDGLSSAVNP